MKTWMASLALATLGSVTWAQTPVNVAAGKARAESVCSACHGLNGGPVGGDKGPSLAGIGRKMDVNAISAALVRAHADTNQNLTLGQIRALARELAASKSGS